MADHSKMGIGSYEGDPANGRDPYRPFPSGNDWIRMGKEQRKEYICTRSEEYRRHLPRTVLSEVMGPHSRVTDEQIKDEVWSSSLACDEMDALKGYTGAEYMWMNSLLYKPENTLDVMGERADDLPDLIDRIRLVDRALERAVLDTPITVYRYVGADYLGTDPRSREGDTVYFDNYTSTSIDPEATKDYGTMRFDILVPAGKGIGAYIKPISENERDYEFLIRRGAVFNIMKRHGKRWACSRQRALGGEKMKAGDLLIYERTEDELGRPLTRFDFLYGRLGTKEDAERGRQRAIELGMINPDGTPTEAYRDFFYDL